MSPHSHYCISNDTIATSGLQFGNYINDSANLHTNRPISTTEQNTFSTCYPHNRPSTTMTTTTTTTMPTMTLGGRNGASSTKSDATFGGKLWQVHSRTINYVPRSIRHTFLLPAGPSSSSSSVLGTIGGQKTSHTRHAPPPTHTNTQSYNVAMRMIIIISIIIVP